MTSLVRPRLLTVCALAIALASVSAFPVTASIRGEDTPPTNSAETSPRSLVPEGGVVAYSLVAPTSVSASGIIARAIVPAGTSCPSVSATVKGKATSLPMKQRTPGASTGSAFSAVVVCDSAIPQGATTASILGTSIPAAMPKAATSIAYLSDTGCRIKLTVQNCASAKGWPLGTNANLIAQSSPGVIIHGGDYIYREKACPASNAQRCGGSPAPNKGMPFLDNAALWFADFFDAVAPMLSTAPIIASRGNHEACDVAGNGFFLFMDPRPTTATACAPKGKKVPVYQSSSWAADISLAGGKDVRILVVDSTNGWDSVISPYMPTQRQAYAQAAKLAKGAADAWLVVHRPLFGITSSQYNKQGDHYWVPWVSADQAAAAKGLLGPYSLIISGHEHLSQAVQVPKQPPQFVAGGGATSLNPKTGYETPKYGALAYATGKPMSTSTAPYKPPTSVWTNVEFAIVLATPGSAQGAWNIDYTGPDGSTVEACNVAKRKVTCQAD